MKPVCEYCGQKPDTETPCVLCVHSHRDPAPELNPGARAFASRLFELGNERSLRDIRTKLVLVSPGYAKKAGVIDGSVFVLPDGPCIVRTDIHVSGEQMHPRSDEWCSPAPERVPESETAPLYGRGIFAATREDAMGPS